MLRKEQWIQNFGAGKLETWSACDVIAPGVGANTVQEKSYKLRLVDQAETNAGLVGLYSYLSAVMGSTRIARRAGT
jgi:hypothetical protein